MGKAIAAENLDKEIMSFDTPFVRLSACVNMTPRSKATDETLKARKEGFENGMSFNHCPHQAIESTSSHSGKMRRKLPAECSLPLLDDLQRSLLLSLKTSQQFMDSMNFSYHNEPEILIAVF